MLTATTGALASIPSPGSNQLGPFHMYGLMIALGVVAAVELARARWRARGGNPDDLYAIAVWAVPAGLIGARLYHVVTDWRKYTDAPLDALKIWEGGLGIPGGMALGIVVGLVVARRRGMRLASILDAAVPALPLAQAIGRLGNWWNQELFGRPTDLPWAVEIDPVNRPDQHLAAATFHPTFLYEMLWNLALCGLLIWIDRRRAVRPGNLLPLYVGGYFLGRLWVEALRIDEASTVLGLRVNIWMSLIGIGGAAVAVAVRGLRRRPDDSDEPYRDGHRWSPEGEVAAAGAGPETGADADAGDRAGEPGEPGEVVEAGTGTGTDTDTDRASISDEPAEGPSAS